jgi:hypothetical protein
MNIDHGGQKDDASAEVAELESRFFGRPRPGRATEQLLWACALGVLSIEEEDRVHALIAGDVQAREALARIERSLETEAVQTPAPASMARTAALRGRSSAGAPCPAPSLAFRVWGATGQALKDAWAALSLKPEEVVAVFLRRSGGLQARALLGAEVALEPAYLSRGPLSPTAGAEAAPGASSRKRVRMPDGTEVSVVCEPGGGFRLIVSLSNRSIQGLVKVRKLVVRNGKPLEEETGVEGRIKDGVATLKECPEGALRIFTPDGRSLVVVLGEQGE